MCQQEKFVTSKERFVERAHLHMVPKSKDSATQWGDEAAEEVNKELWSLAYAAACTEMKVLGLLTIVTSLTLATGDALAPPRRVRGRF